MILYGSSSNSVDKEISLLWEWGVSELAVHHNAGEISEMRTCSVRRQNKVADRSSDNRCGTAVATAASVEILAKGNHHAFSSSTYFTKFVSILDCLETTFPMLATCELAIHPTRPHIPKQHQLGAFLHWQRMAFNTPQVNHVGVVVHQRWMWSSFSSAPWLCL